MIDITSCSIIKIKRSKYSNYTGIYKDNILRSYLELLKALELEYVLKKSFKTESIVLIDSVGNKKIPDFVIYNNDKTIDYLIELKSSKEEIDKLIQEYKERNIDTKGLEVKFEYIHKKSIKDIERQLQKVIGFKNFIEIVYNFKNQSSSRLQKTYFRGENHGMFGRRHTDVSKTKMRDALKNHPRRFQPRKKYVIRKKSSRIYNVSLETRLKISRSVTALNKKLSVEERKIKYGNFGCSNPMWGKTRTIEVKQAISLKNKGRKLTEQQRLNRVRSGQQNGMSGKKHSLETRNLQSINRRKAREERKRKGELRKNSEIGFSGKKHSDKTRKQMSLNSPWKDPQKKILLLKNRFLSHISKFRNEEKYIFNKYCSDVISGMKVKRPKFCAKIGAVNMDNIIRNFLSVENFIEEMRNLGYDFTT